MRKEYKIVKSELFKEQEKKLPIKEKRELKSALKEIAKNPMKAPCSMNMGSPPSAEEIMQWMAGTEPPVVDEVLEYLHEKGCLNEKGRKLAHDFRKRYIK